MSATMTKWLTLLVLSICVTNVRAQEAKSTEHPLAPAIRYTEKSLARVQALPCYEATFDKREIIGRSVVNQKMKIKIRHEPFSVYLYFQEPSAGREVLYVEGKNNGKLIAHESGLLSLAGSMELAPTDPLVM